MKTLKCFSCGGEYPDIKGPVHRYMSSSPGCWATFGEILAREYSDPEYFFVHRITVDSYAVSHPGGKDKQSIRLVGLHLIRLCLFFEYGLTAEKANYAMVEAGRDKDNFTWLEPPGSMGEITAADVFKAKTVDEHRVVVRAWGKSVWNAWSDHHDTIRSWIPHSLKATLGIKK